ncbi:hypothetical protein CONPUDRAFT_161844 [Coniophora puteana RWD-64-598 SS2]|uniref:NADH dehydrogenase [ubiquinone] 1 alpha subcomplex subunit n=1 Tax=Coniophora puteana (strain RWD-64-598) TaxID=741705 RepID=A0A5M3N734_CONPW|nr:uncharacterized protein CONPUDRAFT_161844 [Coniophora puteana RWD-64-598 SS2]EIW87260.1 hypothetical protein CONPUDRAFT_161844 [Coniophora puteana RWD-64-598 SS2]
MSSFVTRLWRRFLSPTGFVGRDLEGNKYYERVASAAQRTKRTVKYREGGDMWTYVDGKRRLPVQWTSWLTHTRPHPPTIAELQADVMRQERVRINAAIIDARYAKEHVTIEAPNPKQPLVDDVQVNEPQPHLNNTEISQEAEQAHAPPPRQERTAESTSRAQDPFRLARQNATDEPQAWAPKSVQRGA